MPFRVASCSDCQCIPGGAFGCRNLLLSCAARLSAEVATLLWQQCLRSCSGVEGNDLTAQCPAFIAWLADA